MLELVLDHANDVDRGAVLVLFRYKWDLRPRYHQRYGNVIMGVVDPEICGSHIDGYIDIRQFRRDLVEHLLLAILFIEVTVVFRSVVAVAVFELQARTIHHNLHAAKLATHLSICVAVAQKVIGRGTPLHRSEDAAEIVGIEEGFATGVSGEGGERLLAI